MIDPKGLVQGIADKYAAAAKLEGIHMQDGARIHAQNLWNSLACGELSGDKSTVEYFLAVERDRLPQIGWAKDYFDYAGFAGKKVLEIGIGQGTDLMQFARAGAECYGVDITDNHLELTARNFRLQGKTVDLRKADATKIPFPDNTFDCVYSLGVIHHIPEADRVLAEFHRVLKPGGKVMLGLYHKWSAYHLKLLTVQGVLKGHLFRAGYDGSGRRCLLTFDPPLRSWRCILHERNRRRRIGFTLYCQRRYQRHERLCTKPASRTNAGVDDTSGAAAW